MFTLVWPLPPAKTLRPPLKKKKKKPEPARRSEKEMIFVQLYCTTWTFLELGSDLF